MIRKQTLIGLVLSVAPLLALAQNTNTPGGQASTGTPLDQTKTSSQKPAADKSTSTTSTTTPDATSNGGGTMAKRKSKAKSSGQTPAGDVPTYPAPTPDGTPTK